MTETETSSGWLSREQLREARQRLPILYVEVVPVRVDERGVVTTPRSSTRTGTTST